MARDALPEDCLTIAGTFDPMTAEHVRRLREMKDHRPLTVAIHDSPRPILPAAARAELVAALGFVDYVVIGGPWDRDETAAHGALLEDLIAHVARRHAQ